MSPPMSLEIHVMTLLVSTSFEKVFFFNADHITLSIGESAVISKQKKCIVSRHAFYEWVIKTVITC